MGPQGVWWCQSSSLPTLSHHIRRIYSFKAIQRHGTTLLHGTARANALSCSVAENYRASCDSITASPRQAKRDPVEYKVYYSPGKQCTAEPSRGQPAFDISIKSMHLVSLLLVPVTALALVSSYLSPPFLHLSFGWTAGPYQGEAGIHQGCCCHARYSPNMLTDGTRRFLCIQPRKGRRRRRRRK
jgi:hypothetical protein